MSSSIDNIDLFSTISFSEIPNDLFLSDRKDLKYIVGKGSIPSIFNRLKEEYMLVVKDGKSMSLYKTNYFDTNDFVFYADHHRGKMNRQKVRTRTYEDGKSFLEIKTKDNKGYTHKNRTEIDSSTFQIDKYNSFLTDKLGIKLPLEEKLCVKYIRVTLYHKSMNEKLTLDFSYQVGFHGKAYEMDNIVIVESKGVNHKRSFFNLMMNEMKIRPVSFSKYCFGLVNIEPSVKVNNFMPLIKKVKKMIG